MADLAALLLQKRELAKAAETTEREPEGSEGGQLDLGAEGNI